MLWLTRDGEGKQYYVLWSFKPTYSGAAWSPDCGTYFSWLPRTFHRKHEIRLTPGKDGICRVDMALTRRD